MTKRLAAATLCFCLGLPAASLAAALDPSLALAFPGLAALLPAGTVAGDPYSVEGPAITTAAQITGSAGHPAPLRVAAVVLEPSPAKAGQPAGQRLAHLVLGRQTGAKLVLEMDRSTGAHDSYGLTMGALRPRGELAVAVQWAGGSGGHEGNLEVWALSAGPPSKALDVGVESFYFQDVDAKGYPQLVVYQPETDSLVWLPRVYDWEGERLVESKGRHEGLDRRLLADYDEVLSSYKESSPAGDPPRLVMDAALGKGRLLERRGEMKAAFLAYEDAVDLVPASLVVGARQLAERRDILERVAEAKRRAVDIYTGKTK